MKIALTGRLLNPLNAGRILRLMALLEENNKALRGELGRTVRKQLRIVPEIVFYLDTSLDYAEHIEELLKK